MAKEIEMKSLRDTSLINILDAMEDATNVKAIVYDNDDKRWTVHYKNGLEQDVVESEGLLDWLQNA